jgi:HK97 gp10 family phage protein
MAYNADAIAGRVQGLRAAKAAFQALPEAVRDRTNDATETTVREIVRLAGARILASPSIRTRALLGSLAWKLNRKTGRGTAGVKSGTVNVVGGTITARPVNPARYAHLVEFGTVKMPAEPFMLPAAESQKQPYLSRCVAAGRNIEKDLANIGSRNL